MSLLLMIYHENIYIHNYFKPNKIYFHILSTLYNFIFYIKYEKYNLITIKT